MLLTINKIIYQWVPEFFCMHLITNNSMFKWYHPQGNYLLQPKYDSSVLSARHNTVPRRDVWTSVSLFCWLIKKKERKKKHELTHSGEAHGEMNTLLGRDPSRAHTPTHVCPCLHQGTFLHKHTDVYARTHRLSWRRKHTSTLWQQCKCTFAQVAQIRHCGFGMHYGTTTGKRNYHHGSEELLLNPLLLKG